jgi:hypothetical protein
MPTGDAALGCLLLALLTALAAAALTAVRGAPRPTPRAKAERTAGPATEERVSKRGGLKRRLVVRIRVRSGCAGDTWPKAASKDRAGAKLRAGMTE